MSDMNLLTVYERDAWREWLSENYQTAAEVWLVYHRKHTGIPRIPFNDAVEEAYGTDPLIVDSDNDGISDGDEVTTGRNPSVNEGAIITILQQMMDE